VPGMNRPFFLDTTVWIHFLRGARSHEEYASLQARFSAVRCLEVTDSIWERAGKTAYLLRKEGVNVPLTDTLIAVLALHNEMILLHDDRHCEMIASVVDLRQQYLKPAPQ
jgi:predicted nucleic acid-binding protein